MHSVESKYIANSLMSIYLSLFHSDLKVKNCAAKIFLVCFASA